MKLSKYCRVHIKLLQREIQRRPHLSIIAFTGFITFSLGSYIAYNSFIKDEKSISTFTLWSADPSQTGGRTIAAIDNAQCDFDQFDLSKLKNEIRSLEAGYETGHSLEGSLFGLNLQKIPYIQAQFLADNNQFIGDKTKSYNNLQCEDAICVLKHLYQGDNESAHLAYFWYLKTGSILSMSNKLPEQKSIKPGVFEEVSYQFSEYLFTKNELKNFYILAKSLPVNFLHTPLLKSIHKVPSNERFGKSSVCSKNTTGGAILLSPQCMGFSTLSFLKGVTSQISQFVDIEKGLDFGYKSISQSKLWRKKSLWIEKSSFDPQTMKYTESWQSFLKPNEFVSNKAKINPTNQLTELLTHYRYNSKRFTQKTPIDIQKFIAREFYNNESFDANGLYKQFINTAVTSWNKKEMGIWQDCLDSYIPKGSESGARELANKIDSPLFTCVENKIPAFTQALVKSLKSNNFQGCQFFNDNIAYKHLSDKFYTSVDKYLTERVLARKIELQNHGEEVLLGQKLKEELVSKLDPVKVYISCHSNTDQQKCFESRVNSTISNTLLENKRKLSHYYYNFLKTDFKKLFSFEENRNKAHELTKKFLAPFYNKVTFAAENIWQTCKNKPFKRDQKINLPLKFSGGKHFVNANLLNCLNNNIDNELYNIVELSAFKIIEDKKVNFQLDSIEQDFAKGLLEKRMVQIFNSILESEVHFESIKIKNHFEVSQNKITTRFLKNSSNFKDIYSVNQIMDLCLKSSQKFYPKSYFYQTKSNIDSRYAKTLCRKTLKHPTVSKRVRESIQNHWRKNKAIALDYLDEYFADYVSDCKDDYNSERMQSICIENSFSQALDESIAKWREEDSTEHFIQNEFKLGRELASLKHQLIEKQSKK